MFLPVSKHKPKQALEEELCRQLDDIQVTKIIMKK